MAETAKQQQWVPVLKPAEPRLAEVYNLTQGILLKQSMLFILRRSCDRSLSAPWPSFHLQTLSAAPASLSMTQVKLQETDGRWPKHAGGVELTMRDTLPSGPFKGRGLPSAE